MCAFMKDDIKVYTEVRENGELLILLRLLAPRLCSTCFR